MSEKMSPQDLSHAITQLVQTAQVTQRGYQEASKNIGDQELRKLFDDYATQRQGFITELQKLGPASNGSQPENTAVPSAKQAIGWNGFHDGTNWSNEKAVLAEVSKMEQQAVSSIEKTLKTSGMPAPIDEAGGQQLALYKEGAIRAKTILDNPQAPERTQIAGLGADAPGKSRPASQKHS